MKRICVFCGSRAGDDSRFIERARALGGLLAQSGLGTVYGGGATGMMGAVADGALAAGGEIIGVIPEGLFAREGLHQDLSELRVVASMHERKATMASLADGFITLPGGIGTLEELFEVWTWAQLGVHGKPCGILNIAGYYDPLLDFVTHMVAHGFLEASTRGRLLVAPTADMLLEDLRRYHAQPATRWIGEDET